MEKLSYFFLPGIQLNSVKILAVFTCFGDKNLKHRGGIPQKHVKPQKIIAEFHWNRAKKKMEGFLLKL